VRVAAVVTLSGILDDIRSSNLSEEDKDAKLVSSYALGLHIADSVASDIRRDSLSVHTCPITYLTGHA